MGAASAVAMAAPMFLDAVTPPVDQATPMADTKINQRPEYQNRILEGGFNPQSELYRLAGDRQAAQINRQMALRGMANSGTAIGAQNQAMTDLNNRFLENEQQRRIAAYNTVMAPEYQQANLNQNSERHRADQRWAQYGVDSKARSDKIQGFGNMMGSMAGGMGGMGGGGMGGGATGGGAMSGGSGGGGGGFQNVSSFGGRSMSSTNY